MKSINCYIQEAIDVEKSDNGFDTITLITRDNVDCSKLSKEDFIKFMSEDILEANKIYKEENKQNDKEAFDRELNWRKREFIKYAEKKWKTDKKREEYVETALKNLKLQPKESKLTRIDIESGDISPLKSVPSINIDNLNTDLSNAYDIISKKDIFIEATGWKIKYSAMPNSTIASFYPYVYFIVSDSKRKEIEDEKKRLANNIINFYKDTNYWGD